MKERIVAALATATILSGCSEINDQLTTTVEIGPRLEHVDPIKQNTIREVDSTFHKFLRYWNLQSLTRPTVRLDIIQNDEVATCNTKEPISDIYDLSWDDPAVIEYCFTNHNVEISQASIEMLDRISSTGHIPFRGVLDIVIGHELGHWVQQSIEGLTNGEEGMDREENMEVENQSDCFSGYVNSQTHTGALPYAASFYPTLIKVAAEFGIHDDGSHGTPAQRVKSFTEGEDDLKACLAI
jgi:hypothetical protein